MYRSHKVDFHQTQKKRGEDMAKLKVAIIGQGRSGRDIHGRFLKGKNNDIFEVAVIVEKDARRRDRAITEYPGCEVVEQYQDLLEREDIDLVVNASYSKMHYSITKDLLLHKFNVLVEKPMASNYYECAELLRIAEENGVVLAVFQQSFLAPFYLFIKELIASGKLGEIKQISLRYNNFSRRWDWQTLQCEVAGGIYNTGPHPIGLALDLLDYSDETRVAYSKLGCALTSGDSDDYAKIILTAPAKPVVDLEICNIDAFNDYNIKLLGTKGTIKCKTTSYTMKYIVDGENPERPVIRESLQDAEGYPMYCSEELKIHEEEGTFVGTAFDVGTESLYRMLHKKLTEGTPLTVTAEHAAKIINVIETIHAQNPLPVKFL